MNLYADLQIAEGQGYHVHSFTI